MNINLIDILEKIDRAQNSTHLRLRRFKIEDYKKKLKLADQSNTVAKY